MDSLAAFFDRQIRRHGSREAVCYRPRYRTIRWSYDVLGERVLQLTQTLAAHGVDPGDRVVLCAENSPHWVAAFFAILNRGGVVVPLNPKSTPEQIKRIGKSAEPKLALLSRSLAWPDEAVPCLPVDSAYAVIEAAATRDRIVTENTGELAEIIYTSGTTGDPKGVMLSHGNLLADLDAVMKAVPLKPDDHILTLLPLFHVFGQMTSLLCSLHSGCAVTYLAAPTTRAVREALAHAPATHLVAVPEVLKTVMDRLESRLGRIPGFLRRAARPHPLPHLEHAADHRLRRCPARSDRRGQMVEPGLRSLARLRTHRNESGHQYQHFRRPLHRIGRKASRRGRGQACR
jgi:long-chain acyl-CoA synthetase